MTKFLPILLISLSLFLLLTIPNLLSQNLIGDESVYILEGDRYTHEPNSYYNNSGSPHLLKMLSGMVIYALPLNRDYNPYFQNQFTNVYNSADFTYVQNSQYAQQIITLTRIPHLVLAVILAISIYLFTKKQFGQQAAIIALILFTTNSNILANAPTSNLDIGTATLIFLTSISFFYFLKHSPVELTTKSKSKCTKLQFFQQKYLTPQLVMTGILLGLAQVTKISAILIYPIFIIYFLYIRYTQKNSHSFRHLFLIFTISFITIWSTYGFSLGPILLSTDNPFALNYYVISKLPFISSYSSQITDLLKLPIYPAGAFFNNFNFQLTHQYLGHTTFLNGQFFSHSAWYFIPIIFLIKNPLTLSALIALSIFSLIKYSKKQINSQIFLLIPIILFVVWSLRSSLQLGLRYIMPMFPFLFIWIATNIATFLDQNKKSKITKIIIYSVITLYSVSNIAYFPNFFAYRNELSRLQNPIEQITDSDYDWGQNIYLLSEFQKANKIYPLYLKSFSGANLSYYNIDSKQDAVEAFSQKNPGYYAFSHSAMVSLKQNNQEIYQYLSVHQPDFVVGQNIYIYKLPK
jgi:hypothetical protein